ncbi:MULTISPECIES: ABC transporter substrate-binding protein [unclassified Methylobacterium]|jgi:putative ABC transport system substrate-binding protein|uniref:ABC transporter substrate-binding protein n=1 Tax=unclassified Methylobacterium TaxID=2615210 RepID=UPI00135322D4|nr:ABC transporter substrate-binding protein [Methylobacterium sp. 2A]MWV22974.1 ABC transporter substrate-binding protein [Methylobacterium sp. 2A]
MRRRDVIAGLGGAAILPTAGWSQADKRRRLGILLVYGAAHPDSPVIVETLRASLRGHGWIWGQNLAVDLQFGDGDTEKMGKQTEDMLARQPDIVLAQGVVGTTVLQRATKTTPVVFMMLQDPVGAGFVSSLSHPDGNLTGFTNFDFSLVGKWLQLLKELSPETGRALALINPDYPARLAGYTAELARIGPELGIDARIAGIHDAPEIERAVTAFAKEPRGGLIVLPDAVTGIHGPQIIALAAAHRLPAVYAYEAQIRQGGLAAYTTSVAQEVGRAAGYIDRILRGASVGSLPVQAAARFLTVINVRTAATLGLTISPSLMAKADELIE